MMSNHAIDGYMFVRHMVEYGDVLFDLSLVDVVSCLNNPCDMEFSRFDLC